MTEKELKKISKRDLIQMVLTLSDKEAQLTKENEQLKEQLKDRNIVKDNAGSIAEASLSLNQVFADAQKAADQYLDNIRAMQERQQEICEKREAASKAESERMLKEASAQSEAMLNAAKSQSQSYWTVLQNKLDSFYEAHRGLKQMLEIPAVMVGEVEDKKKDLSTMLEERAQESTNRLFASMDQLQTAKNASIKDLTEESDDQPKVVKPVSDKLIG